MIDFSIDESVVIWFYRMFSVCKTCGTLLHSENCYGREGTRSHRHAYCKDCYIELQKARYRPVVKSQPTYYYLINNDRMIFFDTKDEKEQYLRERKSLAKFSKISEGYSSRFGCTDVSSYEDEFCDQCGGTLRYNRHGELECMECQLIADVLPIEIERNLCFDKQPHSRYSRRDALWSYDSYHLDDEETDDGCFDIYYSRAYSKRNR